MEGSRSKPSALWSPEETALLTELYPDSTAEEIAIQFRHRGYTRTMLGIERKAGHLHLRKSPAGMAAINAVRNSPGIVTAAIDRLDWLPTFDQFERFSSPCMAVCSDLQIPYVDVVLIRRMLKIAKQFGAKECVLGGDSFNQDMFSKFMRFLDKGLETWDFEMEVCSEILKMLLEHFETIYVISGNHDRRILQLLLGKVKLKHIFKWVTDEVDKRVKVSEYPYCIATSGDTKIRISHPKSYSVIPTRVAQRLAAKWECSVMTAHMHRLGLVFSESGHWVADLGGMFCEDKIEYVCLNETTHGRWNSGFFVVRDGFPYMFSKEHTDWNYWLK